MKANGIIEKERPPINVNIQKGQKVIKMPFLSDK